MITVIIPTLNEEETIQSVIQFAWSQPTVTEVVVVDDKSIDATVVIAVANMGFCLLQIQLLLFWMVI